MTGCATSVRILGVLTFLLSVASASQMTPHAFQYINVNIPRFEGWTTRILDTEQKTSIAFRAGTIEIGDSSVATGPITCVSLLISKQDSEALETPTKCYSDKYIDSVIHDPKGWDPDDASQPNFELTVKDGEIFRFNVTANRTHFYVKVGEHTLEGKTEFPVPWGPNGLGPDGKESSVYSHIYPMHWFVYSLRSTVSEYTYSNDATGEVVRGITSAGDGPNVVAHMEKYYGIDFSKAWVWAQGVDPKTNVSFALNVASKVKDLTRRGQTQRSGYRNPSKGISCSFGQTDSLYDFTHDACKGTVTLDVRSFGCHVIFEVTAPVSSFGSCLPASAPLGYNSNSVQSFTASAKITATKTFSSDSPDVQVIPLSALEFGGLAMCDGKCP